MNNRKRKWYFTFGSDDGFPYQNTYLLVMAETENEAIEIFRSHFPDRHEDCVNCAFWYSEEQWHGSDNEKYYGNPAEIIE